MEVQENMVLLKIAGGLLALLAHLVLIVFLLKKSKTYEQSFTAWILGAFIDFFIFWVTLEEGGNFYLALAYGIGSLGIALVLLFQKKFRWKIWDTITAGAVIICLIIWWQTSNEMALIAGILASVISFIPQIKDTATDPKKTPWIVYCVFLLGDTLSFWGKEDFSIQEFLYAFIEGVLSLIILLLVLHGRKRKN
jgi:hypothetical protein